jgi:hypothetical protein
MLLPLAISLATIFLLAWLSFRANAAYGKRLQLPRNQGGLGEAGLLARWNTLLVMPAIAAALFIYLLVTTPAFTQGFIVLALGATIGHIFNLFLLKKRLAQLKPPGN